LPEWAENFIHRVGRTGRAGKQGLASTLFVREQRSELFELERTLGIRMERIGVNVDLFEKRDGIQGGIDRIQSTTRSRMVQLPGESLQALMEG
jgi:superfamily II DNA/RNA helicase